LFSSGSIQWLMVTDVEMVKEIVLNTSLILGKPSFLSKDNRPLLGKGILSSSGLFWAHQRKIIAPELYLDKMKVSQVYTLYILPDKRCIKNTFSNTHIHFYCLNLYKFHQIFM